jgi:hypothetical protein
MTKAAELYKHCKPTADAYRINPCESTIKAMLSAQAEFLRGYQEPKSELKTKVEKLLKDIPDLYGSEIRCRVEEINELC